MHTMHKGLNAEIIHDRDIDDTNQFKIRQPPPIGSNDKHPSRTFSSSHAVYHRQPTLLLQPTSHDRFAPEAAMGFQAPSWTGSSMYLVTPELLLRDVAYGSLLDVDLVLSLLELPFLSDLSFPLPLDLGLELLP